MSMVEELKDLLNQVEGKALEGFKAYKFFNTHGQALVEAIEQNESLWELVCWNIDNFRDLPLTDGYHAKWLERAEALLARTKAGAGGGS